MTQQDGTGHGTGLPGADRSGAPAPGSEDGQALLSAADPARTGAASQPDAVSPAGARDHAGSPVRPSPYLQGGSAVPDAYLAPPQPGQPRYGDPLPYRPGPGSSQRYARPGADPQADQRGYGQAGDGQPARPGYRRPGPARRARDAAAPSPWQRMSASVVDWLLIQLIATAATLGPLLHLWRQLQTVRLTYPDLSSPGAQAAFTRIASEPASQRALLTWILAIFGVALVYFWVQHALGGATIGKRLLRLRVVTASGHAPVGVRAAGIRAVVTVAGPLMFLVLPSPVSLLGGVLWTADLGLALLDPRVRCLHDMAAGTMVVREQWLAGQPRAGSW
jgi:uncharacterized RDD family membrane protein YckC